MNFKKHESGRSMVEMLGVLAIIGVLSVGGIAGYSLSMRRHRANQVVDIASKYALVVYNTCYQKALESEDGIGCNSNAVSFESADVGPLPAGVEILDHSDRGMRLTPSSSTEDNDEGFVELYAVFTDQKLCQAVSSTIGSITGGNCNRESEPFLTFEIKQN